MKEPKIGDEVITRCGRTKVLRKGVVRSFLDRPKLPEGTDSFLITDDLIVVLGEEVPEKPNDELVVLSGEPVLNTDYSMVYMPQLHKQSDKKPTKKKRNKKKKRKRR